MILSQTKAGKSKICFGTGVLTCLDLKQMRQSEGVWWSGRCQDPTAVQPHMGKCFEGQGKNRHHSPRAYQSIPILFDCNPTVICEKALHYIIQSNCWSLPRFHTFSIIWELATRFSTVYTHPKLTQTTVLFYKNDSVNGGVIWLGLGNAIDLLIFTTPSSILELFFPFFCQRKNPFGRDQQSPLRWKRWDYRGNVVSRRWSGGTRQPGDWMVGKMWTVGWEVPNIVLPKGTWLKRDLTSQVNVNEGDKKGNVERWLLEVQESMIKTLTKAGDNRFVVKPLNL